MTAEAAAGDQPAPKPVQYKPLDDALRATIRETLARNAARIPAQEKLDKAGNAVRQAVEEYGKQLSRIKGAEGAAKPTPPDFAALAKENNLTYERTPLWDILDVFQIQQAVPADTDPACYDIVRANETLFSQQSGMMRRSLINVGFGGGVTPVHAAPVDRRFPGWRSVRDSARETVHLLARGSGSGVGSAAGRVSATKSFGPGR